MKQNERKGEKMHKKTVIGLTGGIGSGKSTVSRYLAEKGCRIIDADLIAREIVKPGMPALAEIRETFGEDVMLQDGSLDRKKLGKIVFADPARLEQLNHITGGRIREEIEKRISLAEDEIIVLDAPLLLESGLQTRVDQVWIVDVSDSVRIRRVMERDGATREEVEHRMKNQLTREQRMGKGYIIIDNSGSMEETFAQADRLLENLKQAGKNVPGK